MIIGEVLIIGVMGSIDILCVVALSVACVVVGKGERASAAFNVVSGITAREEYCLSAGNGKSIVGPPRSSVAGSLIASPILIRVPSLRGI